jgi:release factor glutamine methyltransferase
MKSLLEVLTSGTGYLQKHGVDEARLNMEHLLAHVLGCRRLDIYLRFEERLPEDILVRLRDLIRRRAEGTPLQHLLGTVDFLGHELISDHRALIPRPETEFLVDWLIREVAASRLPRPTAVLDMATGSGCIGLTLASAWKHARAQLTDLSEDALDLARLNASRLGLDHVQLTRSDLFEKVTASFDLIVTNLPYIPSAEIPALSREVRSDPVAALDGGPDGMDLIRRFLREAPAHLFPGGMVALEVGHDQGKTVADIASQQGFTGLRLLADLAGIERFVLAIHPGLPQSSLASAPEPAQESSSDHGESAHLTTAAHV